MPVLTRRRGRVPGGVVPPPVRGSAENVREEPAGRRTGGHLVQRGPYLGGGALDNGGEQGGLGAEILEDHRLGNADPCRHVGDLRGTVPSLGEHLGRRAQDRFPPVSRGQPDPPGRLAARAPAPARRDLAARLGRLGRRGLPARLGLATPCGLLFRCSHLAR